MDAQIRAILQKAGIRTPLDDEDLHAIASSASSASGLSSSHGLDGAVLSASVNDGGGGGGSSADLSLASEVLRTLRSPAQQPAGASHALRFETRPLEDGTPATAGLSDALRRE